MLTSENYSRGFLVDEELMAGITQNSDSYMAFVLRHSTGEYLGTQTFTDLQDALQTLNQIPRTWVYEPISGGCGGKCGSGGGCSKKGGGCKSGGCKKGSCAI